MVEVLLKRKDYTLKRTIGDFFVNGERICYSLEDTVRKNAAGAGKVPGRTAIPAGRYKINFSWSNRFNKMTFEVVGVTNFIGIRWHAGNTDLDTEGCQLPGTVKKEDKVEGSKMALEALETAVFCAIMDDSDRQAWLTVEDTQEPLL